EASLIQAVADEPEFASDAFVAHVHNVLRDEGLKSAMRPTSGAFAVDIAVVHPWTGLYCLGVEIDGPRHALLKSAKAREVWRPKLLARQGMRVHRVWTPAWAADPGREKRQLLEAANAAIQGGLS
ncbi:MAG: hypothetical protein ACOYMK_14560, partial [Hyphomonadaceae bacterium]